LKPATSRRLAAASEPRHLLIMHDSKKPIGPEAAREMAIDMAAFAVLLLYGFLSFGPIAGLFRGGDVANTIIDLAFLATSLWGLLFGSFLLRWLMTSEYRYRAFGIERRQLAIFALVWSTLYLAYVQLAP
jgi:hypothetical protein